MEILKSLTGSADADFHPGQYEAIEALVADHRRALVVQRTGWGKSAVYFISALLQRRAGSGPALIVSPLLALMRDQVAAAERAGVRAAAINSANVTEWSEVERALAGDEIDVLFVSPERLVNPRFHDGEQLPRLVASCGLLVIDEAHCISDWGHDFRPDYRRIRDLIADLPDGVPVLATTATANARVVDDVAEQMAAGGREVFTLRGALGRDSLRLGMLDLGTPWRRLAWLSEHLAALPGSGIVYCLTVAAAEDTAALLAKAGHRVLPYTGRTDPAERLIAEEALKRNDVKALIATSALGMGFDKPDLGFVVHLGAPSSPVAYYQQVGRAGRATESADVLLLPGAEDQAIWRYFATNAMPTQRKADAVLEALAGADRSLSVAALEARVDIRRGPLELLLKVLAVDGAVESVKGGWVSTGAPWTYDADRYDRIAAARLHEQRAMLAYEQLDECRMAFLTAELDDPHAAACGRCDACAGPWYPTEVTVTATQGAQSALDRGGRAARPAGIVAERARQPGRLGRWSPGPGQDPARPDARRRARGRTPLRPRVGRAAAGAVRLRSGRQPRRRRGASRAGQGLPPGPAGVGLGRPSGRCRVGAEPWTPATCRVARHGHRDAAGRLEVLGPLGLSPERGPSEGSTNSAYRVRDVWDRFTVPPDMAARLASLGGPVLLVDDLVDSRWTITIAGRLLLRAGAAAVLPFALASAG